MLFCFQARVVGEMVETALQQSVGSKKIHQANEITVNTSLTQLLPSCYCSNTQQPGRFGIAVLVKDPQAIYLNTLPLNILPSGWKDTNSLRDQREMPNKC